MGDSRKNANKIFNFFLHTDQLNEIRRIKLSRIVCDNSDNLESAQVYVMVLPDPDMYSTIYYPFIFILDKRYHYYYKNKQKKKRADNRKYVFKTITT